MLNKLLISSAAASIMLSTSLFASSEFIQNLDDEFSYNQQMIKEYKSTITKLEQRNKYLTKVKSENPKLYVSKPLYENKKSEYIYRVKLNGAEAKHLNFTIKNHTVQLEMNLKTEKNDENGYYSSSQEFYQEFSIPKDVKESKIKNKVDGDYFEIIMPKK
jgi:HSP20 family molecular chaperone IbpA